MKSKDSVSMFEDIEDLIITNVKEEVKINSSYRKLFDLIDNDSPEMLDAQELQTAAKSKEIKSITSKYIVKHSSEWNDNINIAKVIMEKIEGKKEEIDNLEEFEKYYNKMQKRITNLAFFNDCKSIPGFPQSDEVYHINPIGIVEEFESTSCNIDIDKFIDEYKKNHPSVIGWYDRDKTSGKYVRNTTAKLNSISETNLKKLIKGLISYYKISTYKCSIPKLAYILATIRLESYQYRKQEYFGITEEKISYKQAEIDYGCGKNARRKKSAMLNRCLIDGDGYKYRGRGFVQITWRINYAKFNNIKGINFVNEPDKMLDFDIQVAVTIEGMEKGLFSKGNTLSKYINDIKKDYIGARAIINSNDKDWIIDFYAKEIEKCLLK